MKLQRYLKEERIQVGRKIQYYTNIEVDEFMHHWSQIEKECKPFIEMLRKEKTFPNLFFRGSKDAAKPFARLAVRKDRRPKDTPTDIHHALDDSFKRIHGWKARSQSLFVAGNYDTAKGYGSVYTVLPVGRFKYLWSPTISDLYSDIVEDVDLYEYYRDDIEQEIKREWEDSYNYPESNGSWWYKGDDTGESSVDDAVDYVVKNLEQPDPDDEDYDEDDLRDSIGRELYWEPEISLEQFIENHFYEYELSSKQIFDYFYERIRQGDYKNSNIREYFYYSSHEVMLGCDYYYQIHGDWTDLVIHFIYHEDDPRQLSLFEGRK